jgi:multiple sugar transport system ATP-binding protein
VATTEALGFEQLVHVEIPAVPVVTAEVMEIAADVDATVVGELEAEQRENRAVLVGRFPTGSRLAPGDEVDLVVDCTKLHLFDLDTGMAIGD